MDFREWSQALDLTYWFDRWSRACYYSGTCKEKDQTEIIAITVNAKDNVRSKTSIYV